MDRGGFGYSNRFSWPAGLRVGMIQVGRFGGAMPVPHGNGS